ncbi:MAG: Omp28-related outer membrane protein [bacterium]
MKKSVLFSVFLFALTVAVTQNVPREMVALEIGTGTWCTYCPGAAMGADDLLENNCKVAVAENHNGDPFTNQYSNARNSYYSITGYPTAKFDGILTLVGGSYSSSMYSSYLPLYNQRYAVLSLIDMNMSISNSGLSYTVVITMEKVGTLPTNIFKLRFYVTQSHIQYNWQGQNHLNFVNRLMVPNATGTTVDFTGGDIQTVTLNFDMDSNWPLIDCEFIAFLQNDNGKEIMQTVKRSVIDLSVDFTASATQIDKNTVVNFTNNTEGGYIGVPETYTWLFPGAEPDFSTDKNPTTTYTQCGIYDVTLIVDHGGQIDTVVKPDYIQVGPEVNISTIPGDTACWYQPITLDATNPDAVAYLWEPGGATTPSIMVTSGEVGLGSHTYSVTLTSAGGCENQKSHTIFFDACVGIGEIPGLVKTFVYPNPNRGEFTVELGSSKAIRIDLQVVNTLNSIIYEETGIQVNGHILKNMDLDLGSGIYFLVLRNGEGKTMQKLFIIR